MKLKVSFGVGKLVLLGIVVLLALAAVIINVLFLAGVGNLVTNVPVAAGISLAFSILIIAFAATVFFNSNYKFGDKTLTSTISFFKDKVDYDIITDIKENSETKALYILFKFDNGKGEKLSSIRLLVKPTENQRIVDFLREKNPTILYDRYSDDGVVETELAEKATKVEAEGKVKLEKAKLADEVKPIEKAEPVKKAEPVEKAPPVAEKKPVEKAPPAEKAKSVEKAKPVAEKKPVAKNATTETKAATAKPATKATTETKAATAKPATKATAAAKPAAAKPAAAKATATATAKTATKPADKK